MDVVGMHIHRNEQGAARDGGHKCSGWAIGAIGEQWDRCRERELLRVGEQVVEILDDDASCLGTFQPLHKLLQLRQGWDICTM